ncbi:MAG: sorbitol dehydrogenase family protein [Pseudomonas sp.]|uniref:sorbitol dehydrogenase family protein n=1 Tax=Pseudomonas abieticivorans TaxID=2931382 RepID=UPI0020BE2367|nr:sorbitol dehydrogenase family protein [Pseudomonas sp. PIA16]MDE1167822.1 sorbitol dehydrogenase family protein [Pseudomonas sp.]
MPVPPNNAPAATGALLSRRAFVAGSLLACTWAVGSQLAPLAYAAQAADLTPAKAAFLNLSLVLTGRTQLSPSLSQRLLDALLADAPAFADQVQALHQFITQRSLTAATLQGALDAENAAFKGLPRQIVTAWYTGIVGDGAKARCIAYEETLMYAVVDDQLKPPSYAFGGYGSWAAQPAGE